jgi:xylose isomerase
MFYGHIGAMDVMALSLKLAARMIEDGKLDQGLAKRYAGWQGELGQKIMAGRCRWIILPGTLSSII